MAILDATALQEILTNSFPDAEVPVVESVAGDTVTVALPVTERHGRPAARCRDRR